MVTTTFVYDDPAHPDRPTGSVASPAFTPEDRALLLGLDLYEADLCRCGQPRSIAWHTDMDGWYEHRTHKCFACSAGSDHDVVYGQVINTRPADNPLPPFVLGETTSSN